jgi:hypothetical protein
MGVVRVGRASSVIPRVTPQLKPRICRSLSDFIRGFCINTGKCHHSSSRRLRCEATTCSSRLYSDRSSQFCQMLQQNIARTIGVSVNDSLAVCALVGFRAPQLWMQSTTLAACLGCKLFRDKANLSARTAARFVDEMAAEAVVGPGTHGACSLGVDSPNDLPGNVFGFIHNKSPSLEIMRLNYMEI